MGVDTTEILRSILDNISDSVIVIGTDQKVICFNDRAAKTLYALKGWNVQEGDDYRNIVSATNKPSYLASFETAISGKTAGGERELLVNGRKVWYMLQMNPLYDSGNAVAGVIITLTDIDGRKTKEAALNVSETRFRRAFEHSSIGVALVDALGNWMQVNRTLCDIVGYTEAELMALSPDTITHPDDRENDREQLQKMLRGETESYSMEKRFVHKNGTEEWISGVISAVRDNDGQMYFLWQLRHITERKRMIERLRASEDLLHIFVEHSPAAIAMFDMEMRYVQVSRRWMTDYGLAGQHIIGRSHYEVFPTIGEEWKEIHRRCMAGNIEKKDEDCFEREDGRLEWLRWEIHPWRKASGEIGGIIMLTEVITGRKAMEAERARMVADLVSRNRDLNEFADIVSHNLRGPLATIMGLIDMLRHNISDQERDTIMTGIGASAQKLDTVVREMNNILNMKTRPA